MLHYSRIPKQTSTTLTVIVVFIFLRSFSTFSQGLGNSPYSALGVGELSSNAFSSNNAMGDAGVSSANGFFINALNPALLVKNRLTTFEVGTVGQFKRLQDSRQRQQEFSGNMAYLALAFPGSDKWTLGVGIKPYSTVNYQQNSYSKIGSSIYEVKYQYQGQGGINKVYMTNAFQLGKSFSAGIEASYLFGGINKSATTQVKIGDSRDYIVSREDRVSFSDFDFRLGAVYNQKVGKDKFLNFGATYSPSINLVGSRISTMSVLDELSSSLSRPDTLLTSSSSLKIPSTFRAGISYEKPFNLIVALDYEKQDWSQFRGINGTNDGFRSTQSLHMGLEYMPRVNSTKYFDLVWYRAGFKYAQTPLVIGGKTIDDLSLSLGMSLPVGREYLNNINLSVVLGSRGTISANSFRERYARVVLGFSLKERWFQKFKVD